MFLPPCHTIASLRKENVFIKTYLRFHKNIFLMYIHTVATSLNATLIKKSCGPSITGWENNIVIRAGWSLRGFPKWEHLCHYPIQRRRRKKRKKVWKIIPYIMEGARWNSITSFLQASTCLVWKSVSQYIWDQTVGRAETRTTTQQIPKSLSFSGSWWDAGFRVSHQQQVMAFPKHVAAEQWGLTEQKPKQADGYGEEKAALSKWVWVIPCEWEGASTCRLWAGLCHVYQPAAGREAIPDAHSSANKPRKLCLRRQWVWVRCVCVCWDKIGTSPDQDF